MFFIIGWIVGTTLVLVGAVWFFLNTMMRGLNEAEVELMKQDGRFEGEPEYMKKFRVARSEWDLATNRRNRERAIEMFIAGGLMIATLILFRIM